MGSFVFISFPQTTSFGLTPAEIFNAEFDSTVEAFLDDTNTDSMIMSFINGSDIVFTGGYGNQPENDTVHHLAGLSSVITTMAIMHLYENGQIDFAADINDYLPYDLRNPNTPNTPITVEDLLLRRSSILNTEAYWTAMINEEYGFPDIIYEFLHEDGAAYDGTNWAYSGPGLYAASANIPYDILAYILELITTQSYQEYVETNILTPLGMEHTKLNYSDYDAENLATPYECNAAGKEAKPIRNYDGRGSCGWRTTIGDITKLLYIFMNGEYEGTTILNQTTLNLMTTESTYGNDWSYGFVTDITFENFGPYTGLGSGTTYFPDSLGTFAYTWFNEEIGYVSLSNSNIQDDTLNDEIEDFFQYLCESANKLIPSDDTDPEDGNFLFIPLVSSLILLAALVYVRKGKKN